MKTRFGTLGTATRTFVVLGLALLAALPLWYVLVNSFKPLHEMLASPLGLPSEWRFDNFGQAFADGAMVRAMGNTVFLTVLGVAIQVLIGSLAAYGMILAKTKYTILLGLALVGGFAIPLQATLVPQFRMFANAGLTNSLPGLVLLYSGGAVFCYFLIVGYMRSVPRELLEAARIDGAGPMRIYWKLILPLCRPILTTVIIFQTMHIWNDFLIPNVYLTSPQNRTVVLQVFTAQGVFSTDWPLFMATTVIALTPVVILFVFCQRWIVSGLLAGSVKG